ncbi:MAG: NAD(+)/NADH kinase [Armatimonadetes bacterium]|nr:NAD(+)/NADH kinase [Armatimonadota bacterium]
MKSLGLVVNPTKEGSVRLASDLIPWLISKGIKLLVEEEAAHLIGRGDLAADLDRVCEAEMAVVLGGDGTILRAARTAGPKGTPMLGVHLGQYGFITEIHPPDVKPALERVLRGDYKISERMMLLGSLIRGDEVIASTPALNDVVVSKGPLARMLTLHTFVDERLIAIYASDGIIVSSPTGSTAYSLSAGGPVVNPNVKVMIITPICPHTLNARSLVIPDTESVQIVGECGDGPDEMMLTVDGQVGFRMVCSDKVDVRRADFTARIVYWDPMSFYDKIQSRLRWGERFST